MIRAATIDDARAIAEIHVRGWQEACRGLLPAAFLSGLSVERRETVWRETLQRPVPEVLVAEVQGAVRGWICFGPSRDPGAAPTTIELWALYIDPEHWRQGLGRALWQALADNLRHSPCSQVTLWVLKDNLTAVRFYFGAE